MICKVQPVQLEAMVRPGRSSGHAVKLIGPPLYPEQFRPNQCNCSPDDFYDYKVRAVNNLFRDRITVGRMEEMYQTWLEKGR
jgi:hypothetical protein